MMRIAEVGIDSPPETWADLDTGLLNQILTAIDAGLEDGTRYTDAPNAKDRAAWKVVAKHAPGKIEAQAREIIITRDPARVLQ